MRWGQTFKQAWIGASRDIGWSASCIGTVAVGTAFSVCALALVVRIALRPYSFPGDDRLAIASSATATPNADWTFTRVPWHTSAPSVEGAEYYALGPVLLGVGPVRPRITAAYVSSTLDTFLALSLDRGRWLAENEAVIGGARTAVVTDRFMSRYGGQSIGSTIVLGGVPHTVIGIAPDELTNSVVFGRADVFLAFRADATVVDPALFAASPALLRLRPGVTTAKAERDLNETARTVAATPAETVRVGHPKDFLPREMRDVIWMAGVTGLLVLLASCTNLVGLVMARLVQRKRELLIRSALGATDIDIHRQIIVETVLVTLIGAILGIGVGQWLLMLMRGFRPERLFALDRAHVGWATGTLAVVLTTVVAVAALLVALRWLRTSVRQAPTAERSQRYLVAIQVGIATCISSLAVLLVLSLFSAVRTPLGFEPDGLLLAGVQFSSRTEESPAVIEALKIAGEDASAALMADPFFGYRVESALPQREGGGSFGSPISLATNSVTANFFAVTGIPFVAGRGFRSDESDAVVISASLASALHFGPEDMGARIRLSPGSEPVRVVGIVADVAAVPIERGAEPRQSYSLMRSVPPDLEVWWVGPESSRPWLESATIQQGLLLQRLVLADDLVAETLTSRTFRAFSMGVIGVFVLLLATLGEMVLMIQYLRSRADDLAVRSALGASPAVIARHVIVRTLTPAGAGVVAGALLGAWLGYVARTSIHRAGSVVLAVGSGTALIILVSVGLALLLCLTSASIKPQRIVRATPFMP